MQQRSAKEIRDLYLTFFKERGHSILPSASIVPENDPTALFVTAGMHPLVPFLLGQDHPEGSRLANAQKCVRTQDILEVGDNTHDTCFEMMGNWSLGDYFKKEAIEWSFEFLTSEQYLGIPIEKIAVTVFAGDDDAPRDEEAAEIWKSLGVPQKRIFYKGKEDNWWGPAGATGPCGPDTEMFVWTGDGDAPEADPTEDDRWVEIWNDVFMQYFKEADGSYRELEQKNVDTGMGLERVAMFLQGATNIYETDLFEPIMRVLNELVQAANPELSDKTITIAKRIIADHIRTGAMMVSDSVLPSNKDQGYILRRLLRRAVVRGEKLGLPERFLAKLVEPVAEIYGEVYENLAKGEKIQGVAAVIEEEETKFRKSLRKGLKEFEKISARNVDERISGKEAFLLFATYGFPLEMTQELAKERKREIDVQEFWKEFEAHQNLSRKGAEGKFAGGLADHSAESTRHHTATHLLHQALRDVLGQHVFQKGSNITPERLRFDFSHDRAMTKEEIKAVEDIVNEQIKGDLSVSFDVADVSDARKNGAIGVFEERYGNRVKVYKMGDYSLEICGGPHVQSTGELKSIKILKEQAVGAGIRRIKAAVSANEPKS